MGLPKLESRLNEILREAAATRPGLDLALFTEAFAELRAALSAHKVAEAEEELTAAVESVDILAALRLDRTSLLAALLLPLCRRHLLPAETASARYGADFALLGEHLGKLAALSFNPETKQEAQVASFRKMILAMASDLRVVFVWLAARLARLRAEAALPSSPERIRRARETLDIYAPLAGRLGIGVLKTELENLAFAALNPEEQAPIAAYLSRYEDDRRVYIEETIATIRSLLSASGVSGTVYGRVKHAYSTWRKMQKKQLDLEQLYDLVAFRVIVPDVESCYRTLGLVHSRWHPIQGLFEDYIAMPKPNGYQSLHTLVIGPHGERMEIQIRTQTMHDVAENGLAAHWRYKETGGSNAVRGDADRGEVALVAWLKNLLREGEDGAQGEGELFEHLRLDLFNDVIFVFTPGGDVLELPIAASVIDAAFAIHTQVGLHCSGAKVNGRLVPFKTTLKSGDLIEILTQKTQKPHKEWLDHVKTGRARQKIRHALREEDRETSRLLGRELCEREFRRFGLNLNRLEKSGELDRLVEPLKLRDFTEALIAIGRGKLRVRDLLLKLAPEKVEQADQLAARETRPAQKVPAKASAPRKGGSGVLISGFGDMALRFARCCRPVPGDPILGFVTRGRGLTIHHALCPKLVREEPDRLLDAIWDESSTTELRVALKVKIVDKPGMIRAVSGVFDSHKVNIDGMHARLVRHHGEIVFSAAVATMDQLSRLIRDLKQLRGVLGVERVAHSAPNP